jgi:two-component system nitrate/nitrite response regulator NarL
MCGDTAILERIREIGEKSRARILLLIAKRDAVLEESAVLAGARGVVDSEGPPDRVLNAIAKVHEGEVWVNRASVSRLVDCARQRSFRHADPEQRKIATLTGRERQIVATFAKHPGATAKIIAELLNISAHTARNHLNAVYEKLQVANRVELFDYAHRHRLHEPADMVH